MKKYIGCDAHKEFSEFVAIDEAGRYDPRVRVNHDLETFRRYLESLPPCSFIVLEASGCYYWIVEEMLQAGHEPHLANARVAKQRIGGRHKTNKNDARGLAMLGRNGTVPEVWIPPAELRDQREVMRWRMTLSRLRAGVKNRIHGVLQRYNVRIAASDLFGDSGRAALLASMPQLPQHSRETLVQQLQLIDEFETQIGECEKIALAMLQPSVERRLLDTLPCVGLILSAVMALEIGAVERFAGGPQLASYAGLVPQAHESADWKRQRGCPRDCNMYLKWAYVEAANLIAIQHKRWKGRHVADLYARVKQSSKLHGKAVMAVARHLAEASYWMLRKQTVYREPAHHSRPVAATANEMRQGDEMGCTSPTNNVCG